MFSRKLNFVRWRAPGFLYERVEDKNLGVVFRIDEPEQRVGSRSGALRRREAETFLTQAASPNLKVLSSGAGSVFEFWSEVVPAPRHKTDQPINRSTDQRNSYSPNANTNSPRPAVTAMCCLPSLS